MSPWGGSTSRRGLLLLFIAVTLAGLYGSQWILSQAVAVIHIRDVALKGACPASGRTLELSGSPADWTSVQSRVFPILWEKRPGSHVLLSFRKSSAVTIERVVIEYRSSAVTSASRIDDGREEESWSCGPVEDWPTNIATVTAIVWVGTTEHKCVIPVERETSSRWIAWPRT